MTEEDKGYELLLEIEKELKKLSLLIGEGFIKMDEGFNRINVRLDRMEGNLSNIKESLKTTLERFDK
ncbi:hypothetical protein [Metabacillus dongyingensis]|uniref:hypothetical protein n=1 Tax=Metabacillus dongyingensis TaxID=2874282 RepID=UPI001CBDAC64|nr:hypothetical protein [Metabacillus dongyingensis]UAL53509.1 hypothetical protein K8L98_06910 [Metabacillus dongyingensis]